jgi:hypothetical protein
VTDNSVRKAELKLKRAFRKVYLGDSVYVEIENGRVKLTTENGYGPSNTIYLESEVADAFGKYLNNATKAIEAYDAAAADQ